MSTKIVKAGELQAISAKLRAAGKKLVVTNGCFDLLHAGHVRYLQAARQLGDILAVGINSDAAAIKKVGAEIRILPLESGYSTSALIERIRQSCAT